MPTLQGASAFGSGRRSLGPPTVVRNKWTDPTIPPARPPSAQTPSNAVGGLPPPPGSRTTGTFFGATAPPPLPSGAPSSAPASGAPPPVAEWRGAFKAVGRSTYESEAHAPKIRAVIEATRWRSKLGDLTNPIKDDLRQEAYEQPSLSGWALERLLGAHPQTAMEFEDEEQEMRMVRVVGQAWSAAPEWIDVSYIDRLEDTLRRRLGELESSAAHAGRAARAVFADCDPARQGRVLVGPFIETVGRKLNYDFPQRGATPASRTVLRALFERYDLARCGVIGVDDFHAALCGASREGRASGRVHNAIGRLREGLVRFAGGYDALRLEDNKWFALAKAGGHPGGCLPATPFVDGLLRLALLADVRLSDAELNVIIATFEPPTTTRPNMSPAEGGRREPLVSFEEFTRAVRGPPMNGNRIQAVRAAFAALKEDANKGIRKEVRPAHLAARYDVSAHPAVASGGISEEEAAMSFLYPWRQTKELLEEEVMLRTFADRYEWISPLFADDERFEQMVKAAWCLK